MGSEMLICPSPSRKPPGAPAFAEFSPVSQDLPFLRSPDDDWERKGLVTRRSGGSEPLHSCRYNTGGLITSTGFVMSTSAFSISKGSLHLKGIL